MQTFRTKSKNHQPLLADNDNHPNSHPSSIIVLFIRRRGLDDDAKTVLEAGQVGGGDGTGGGDGDLGGNLLDEAGGEDAVGADLGLDVADGGLVGRADGVDGAGLLGGVGGVHGL